MPFCRLRVQGEFTFNDFVETELHLQDDSQLNNSDESEPSWLQPYLELKDFQVGSARDLFHFSLKSKIGRNEPKFDSQLKIYF